jgi:hypothetical protein
MCHSATDDGCGGRRLIRSTRAIAVRTRVQGSVHSLWCTFDPNATTVSLTANSEPLDGPSIQLLTHTCARLNIAMAVGFNHMGLADMPKGKALNAYIFIDGTGIVRLNRAPARAHLMPTPFARTPTVPLHSCRSAWSLTRLATPPPVVRVCVW